MAWVKFIADFDWRQPGFTIAYKDGWSGNVKRDCADAAEGIGAVQRLKTPNRDEIPDEVDDG